MLSKHTSSIAKKNSPAMQAVWFSLKTPRSWQFQACHKTPNVVIVPLLHSTRPSSQGQTIITSLWIVYSAFTSTNSNVPNIIPLIPASQPMNATRVSRAMPVVIAKKVNTLYIISPRSSLLGFIYRTSFIGTSNINVNPITEDA